MSEDFRWGIEHLDDVVPLHPSEWAYDEETDSWIDLDDDPDVIWW